VSEWISFKDHDIDIIDVLDIDLRGTMQIIAADADMRGQAAHWRGPRWNLLKINGGYVIKGARGDSRLHRAPKSTWPDKPKTSGGCEEDDGQMKREGVRDS
jgi:hypothetical protein